MFKLISEIRSKTGVLHFKRWLLLGTPWFEICLHYIAEPDLDRHQHNHPWWFGSIILWGGYTELRGKRRLPRNPLTIGMMGLNQYHRVLKLFSPTWTLVVRGPRTNDDWGYKVNGDHIVHHEYRRLKNEGTLP